MSVALSRHDELMRSAISSFQGVVFKTVGDAFCAVFATASCAVAAAVAAQRALAAESWPDRVSLRVRMGLHSGVCEERDGDYFGPTVNRAARLAAVAHGSQVIVSESTAELARDTLPAQVHLRDLGRHRLKDLTVPEHVFQIDADDLSTQFPPLRSLGNLELGNSLPIQLSSFVGRRRDLSEVRRLLTSSRLVTITGAGGCGKTRTAIEALSDVDGVWFVDLASLTDPSFVAVQVGATLGMQALPGKSMTETLTEALEQQDLCLVLDNCEHVIDSCAELATVLSRSCPKLRILATSRQPLDIDGEQVYRLPSLSLPSDGVVIDREAVADSDAVQLFVERARSRRSDFALDDENAKAVAAICRRLDGIPLAIELAAARVMSFSIADLEARLDDRFRFLGAGRRTTLPRHQTLWASVDWSYDLLPESERTLLRYLAVFSGGFTFEAVETLCSDPPLNEFDVVGLISSLTEKSLIQMDEHTEPLRYGMLETIRQFATERLREHQEESMARAAHVGVFLLLAEAATARLWTAERLEWLPRINAEEANIREAMSTLLSDPEPAAARLTMRLFIAMSRYWEMTLHAAYVLDIAGVLLAHPGTQEHDDLWVKTIAALALIWRGDNWELAVFAPVVTEAAELARERGLYEESSVLHWVLGGDLTRHGQIDAATEIADRSIEDARRSGDMTALGVALIASSLSQQNLREARNRLTEALSCLRQAGDEYWEPTALNNLAWVDLRDGDRDSARRLLNQGIAVSRAGGTNSVLTTLLQNLAELELAEGNSFAAEAAFAEAIRIQIRTGMLDHVSDALIGGIAKCASTQGDIEAAAFLYGAADAASGHAGIMDGDDWGAQHEERLRNKTSGSELDAAFAHGHSLSPREALKVAIGWSDDRLLPGRGGEGQT
jgi:predicted ATPase